MNMDYIKICRMFLPLCLALFEPAINRQVEIMSQTHAPNLSEALTSLAITMTVTGLTKAYLSPPQASQIFICFVESRKDFWKGTRFIFYAGCVTAALLLCLGQTPMGNIIKLLFKLEDSELYIVKLGLSALCLCPMIANFETALEGLLLRLDYSQYCIASEIVRLFMKITATIILMQTSIAISHPILIPVFSTSASLVTVVIFLGIVYKKHNILTKLDALTPEHWTPLKFLPVLKMTLPMGLKELVDRLELFILNIVLANTARTPHDRSISLGYFNVIHTGGYMLTKWLFGIPQLTTIYLSNRDLDSSPYNSKLNMRVKFDRLVNFIITIVTICLITTILVTWVTPVTRVFFSGLMQIPADQFYLLNYPFKIWTFSPIIYGLSTFSLGMLIKYKDTKILIICSLVQVVLLSSLPYLFSLVSMPGLLSGVASLYLAQSAATFLLYIYYFIKYVSFRTHSIHMA